MAVDIKKTLQKLAHKAEIAESAVDRIADVLIEEGYELSKPIKTATPAKEIEAVSKAEAAQGIGAPIKTPADIAVEKGVEAVPVGTEKNQLRIQPQKK